MRELDITICSLILVRSQGLALIVIAATSYFNDTCFVVRHPVTASR